MKAATVSSSSRYLDVASTRDNVDGSEASTYYSNQVNMSKVWYGVVWLRFLVALAIHLLHKWDACNTLIAKIDFFTPW